MLLRPRNEKNRTDGHREPEGSGDLPFPRPQVSREGSGLGLWTADGRRGPLGRAWVPCWNLWGPALGTLSRECASGQGCPGFRQPKERGPGGGQDQRVPCAAGLGVGPGKWVAMVWVKPGPCNPEHRPCLPRCWPGALSATSPTTPSCGQGDEEGGDLGLRRRPGIPSKWDSAQGGAVCLPSMEWSAQPSPRSPAGSGLLGGGSQEQTLPSAPADTHTPQSESHACPCI